MADADEHLADSSSAAALPGEASLRRIAWLTPLFGLLGASLALTLRRPDWAKGVILGAILSWFNFRWLKRGIQAFALAAAHQSGSPRPHVPVWTYLAAALRYGLIGLAVYVIFTYLHFPLVSIVAGLCALGVATIAASVWEILNPVE